jgi:hypothetical protein
MSLTPPPPVTRRDWTLPIVAGVVAIVVVLAVCMVGSAMAFVSPRRPATPGTDLPTPSVLPTQPNVKSGPECLIGDWLETNYVLTTPVDGTEVRFTGKGAVTRFSTDGTVFQLLQNVVYAGSANGSRYEFVVNGSLMLDYEADDTTNRYINPVTLGTSVLKVNGTVVASEELTASLTPETYTCQGTVLRLTGEQSTTEWQRI